MNSNDSHQREGENRIFTIPNCLSFLRLIFLPLILYLYLGLKNPRAAFCLMIVSMLTDLLDGWIARTFHQITKLGKFLDPLADKLTQVVIVACLAFTYPAMRILLCVEVLREVAQGILQLSHVKKKGIEGAAFHGKVSTTALFLTGALHLVWPGLPTWLSFLMAGCAIGSMVTSVLTYWVTFKNE